MSSTEKRPRAEWPFGAAAAAAILLFLIILFANRQEDSHTLPKWMAKTTDQPHAIDEAPWLVATISPVGGIGRRIIIRDTWQRLYANSSRFDMRFVIANASHPWWPHIEKENKTHGDIVMLGHLPESRKVANTIKPIEFFKALVEGKLLRPYSFVSKIDDDTFLEATIFYDRYLAPRLEAARDNKMQLSSSLIGRKMLGMYEWNYPAGAFYTLSWDLVRGAVAAYAVNGTQDIQDEDALTGKLVADSKVQFDFVAMNPTEAFDYVTPENRVWASKEEDLDTHYHALAPGAVQIHNLKSTESWMQVSEVFDENGLREDIWRKHVDVGTWFKNRTLASSISTMPSSSSASSRGSATHTGKAKSQHTTATPTASGSTTIANNSPD